MKPTCQTCRYWDIYSVWQRDKRWVADYKIEGENPCVRRAPSLPLILRTSREYSSPSAEWPLTRSHQWCGDFEAAQEPEP